MSCRPNTAKFHSVLHKTLPWVCGLITNVFAYRRSLLLDECIAILNNIGFVWRLRGHTQINHASALQMLAMVATGMCSPNANPSIAKAIFLFLIIHNLQTNRNLQQHSIFITLC